MSKHQHQISDPCQWRCPVCHHILNFDSGYRCSNGHHFDRAKEGYVNLLLPQQRHSQAPGDSKDMLRSRREFLGKDYYKPLADKIAESCLVYRQQHPAGRLTVLDIGCGEGYYTDSVYELLSREVENDKLWIGGVDISKEAIRMAAKRYKHIAFAVASTANLPVADHSMDIILRIFAPVTDAEAKRCLKPGGAYITATPGAGHLFELRQLIYDTPEEHRHQDEVIDGLKLEQTFRIQFELELSDQSDIAHLFRMTPYYWQTDKSRQQHIFSLEHLITRVDFKISLYRA